MTIINTPTDPSGPDNINNIDNEDENSLEINNTSITQNHTYKKTNSSLKTNKIILKPLLNGTKDYNTSPTQNPIDKNANKLSLEITDASLTQHSNGKTSHSNDVKNNAYKKTNSKIITTSTKQNSITFDPTKSKPIAHDTLTESSLNTQMTLKLSIKPITNQSLSQQGRSYNNMNNYNQSHMNNMNRNNNNDISSHMNY